MTFTEYSNKYKYCPLFISNHENVLEYVGLSLKLKCIIVFVLIRDFTNIYNFFIITTIQAYNHSILNIKKKKIYLSHLCSRERVAGHLLTPGSV